MAEVPVFYVFHGEDAFSLHETVDSMRGSMGPNGDLNTTTLDGKSAALSDIIGAASAMPFLSDKRLVIVEGLLTHWGRGKERLNALADALESLPDSARVVFAEPKALSARHVILKLARESERGLEKKFELPKNATSWIRKRAKDLGAEIKPDAASALANLCGDDLAAADAEIWKLATYVNGARPITTGDVELLTSYIADAHVFDLMDALGERRTRAALDIVHNLLGDQHPLQIMAVIGNQFRTLLLMKEYLEGGGAPTGAASALNMHPFRAKKLIAQARNFTLEQLEESLRALRNLDAGIKRGRVQDTLALDLFVTGAA
jgi:DNA polymerase-3 subunit delta